MALTHPRCSNGVDHRQVGPVDAQQHVSGRRILSREGVVDAEAHPFEDDGPCQRVPVRVETRPTQADESVSGAYRRTVEDPFPLDHAHDEPGQVVFAGGVEVRHLRRLAAEQRARVLLAGPRDAPNHGGDHVPLQVARGEIVQEEERPGPLHQDVVHAMVDEAAAHRVVPLRGERHLQLGAHAVGARYEDRVRHPGGNGVEAAERPESGQGVSVAGSLQKGGQGTLGAVGRVQIDAGVLVCQRVFHFDQVVPSRGIVPTLAGGSLPRPCEFGRTGRDLAQAVDPSLDIAQPKVTKTVDRKRLDSV